MGRGAPRQGRSPFTVRTPVRFARKHTSRDHGRARVSRIETRPAGWQRVPKVKVYA
jgi:hypothetical protein